MFKKIISDPKFQGTAAYHVGKFISKSLRVAIHKDSTIEDNKPYLFAFWHGKQFLPSSILIDNHMTRMCAMVSPSRDGEILSTCLYKFGYEVIRGSSRDGNVRALIAMKKALSKGGVSMGFGIDGPTGPIYEVKPGMIYLAQKLQIPIIPLGSFFQNKWIFNKAWDKFELPKPFSKTGFYLGEPIYIEKSDNIETCRIMLADKINLSEKLAQELL